MHSCSAMDRHMQHSVFHTIAFLAFSCLAFSASRRNHYDATGTLSCARRRNDATRCNGIDVHPRGPLRANMTSSIKPEVHNVATPPNGDRAAAMGNMRKIGADRACSSGDMLADRCSSSSSSSSSSSTKRMQASTASVSET